MMLRRFGGELLSRRHLTHNLDSQVLRAQPHNPQHSDSSVNGRGASPSPTHVQNIENKELGKNSPRKILHPKKLKAKSSIQST